MKYARLWNYSLICRDLLRKFFEIFGATVRLRKNRPLFEVGWLAGLSKVWSGLYFVLSEVGEGQGLNIFGNVHHYTIQACVVICTVTSADFNSNKIIHYNTLYHLSFRTILMIMKQLLRRPIIFHNTACGFKKTSRKKIT